MKRLSPRLTRSHRETGLDYTKGTRLTEKALAPWRGGDMTMTTTDDESQEHREPKSIDDDLRRVLPMHLTSPPAGTEGAPGWR